jgi:hypothetical protein
VEQSLPSGALSLFVRLLFDGLVEISSFVENAPLKIEVIHLLQLLAYGTRHAYADTTVTSILKFNNR